MWILSRKLRHYLPGKSAHMEVSPTIYYNLIKFHTLLVTCASKKVWRLLDPEMELQCILKPGLQCPRVPRLLASMDWLIRTILFKGGMGLQGTSMRRATIRKSQLY